MTDTIIDQPECAECGGACCQPERLEFPVEEGTTMVDAGPLFSLGLPGCIALDFRINEHGRTVVRALCFRRGHCAEETRPEPCLYFPLSYLEADHSDAERAEVAEFCALFRRLQEEAQSDPS